MREDLWWGINEEKGIESYYEHILKDMNLLEMERLDQLQFVHETSLTQMIVSQTLKAVLFLKSFYQQIPVMGEEIAQI